MNDVWRDSLLALIDRLNTRYVTPRQFDQFIAELLARDNCPLSGLTYEVVEQEPYKTLYFGVSAIGTPDINSIELGHTNRTCRISQYLKQPLFVRPPDLNAMLMRLFDSFWKSDFRTPSAGMLDLKRIPQASPMAQQTIEFCISEGKDCVFMFCDLDGFKPLNDGLGQEVGNRVIKQFGALLESNLQPSAVLLHAGGDEFFALLPDVNSAEAIMLAYRVSEALTAYDFKVDSFAVSISFGIASTEEVGATKDYNWLYARAESALKQNAKKGIKGKARFFSMEPFEPSEVNSSRDILVGHCIAKSTLLDECPFGSAWLNCLSSIVVEGLKVDPDITKLTKRVDRFLTWAQIEAPVSTGRFVSSASREDGLYAAPSLLSIDIAFAVIHGFLRWGCVCGHHLLPTTCIRLHYGDDGQNATVSLSDGTSVWTSRPSDPMLNCFEIGKLWNRPNDSDLPSSLARAILVQISHHQPNLPLGLFLERVVVDDRPTRGGGLPDFWEATIARLVVQTLKHTNTAAVYVFGNHEYGKQTVEYLRKVGSWADNDVQMAYKTGLSVAQIRAASNILDGKIHFPSNEDELLKHLSELLRSSDLFHNAPKVAESSTPAFLRRELKLDNFALTQEDGCRVNTIAEAYPIVLEIARRGDSETITDQAGQVLRELIDFKVELLNPSQNLIPSFYKIEEDSFEEYYQSQFVSPTGLFRKVFHETEQLECVLTHLANVMKTPGKQFSTRRAILIVPHDAKKDKEVAPLGLVSIRIIPRFVGVRPRLSFSYTWRTVEALKGFPYSLFGSVKFSQHLTEMLKKRLPQEVARQVEFGTVSYIAHSLHFFLDDYGQNIARRIVDEASY